MIITTIIMVIMTMVMPNLTSCSAHPLLPATSSSENKNICLFLGTYTRWHLFSPPSYWLRKEEREEKELKEEKEEEEEFVWRTKLLPSVSLALLGSEQALTLRPFDYHFKSLLRLGASRSSVITLFWLPLREQWKIAKRCSSSLQSLQSPKSKK